jgi:hypothetical protein
MKVSTKWTTKDSQEFYGRFVRQRPGSRRLDVALLITAMAAPLFVRVAARGHHDPIAVNPDRSILLSLLFRNRLRLPSLALARSRFGCSEANRVGRETSFATRGVL